MGEVLVVSLSIMFSILLAPRRTLLDSALRGERMVGRMRRTAGTCEAVRCVGGEEGRGRNSGGRGGERSIVVR